MAYVLGLRCRACGADYPLEPLHVCDQCFGPLEVVYDYAAIAPVLSREVIVISVTGNGDKTLETVRASVAAPFVINARLQEFEQLYDSLTPPTRQAAAHA